MIQRKMGIGSITDEPDHQPHPTSRWNVQDKTGCQRLTDLLDKYPLRAKKRADFRVWREAVCEWTSRPRGNRWHGKADNTRMAGLRDRLMDGRAYTDVPWSGNEFQDWCRLWAAECLRVLKPGGWILAFGGTRTWHRLVCGIEDAGFEVRDAVADLTGYDAAGLMWVYGSGFPKSLDVSKAIDKRRDDKPEVMAVATWLRERIEASGVTRKAIAERFGIDARGVDLWAPNPTDNSARQRVHTPTWEQWGQLRDMLGFGVEMDAEVWRLNGRKGTPGEAL
jgi:hypothetical protein